MRRLPGPAVCRLSEGAGCSRGSLRIVSGLAENTNSIFCDGPRGPRQQMDVRFCGEQEPPAERHQRARRNLISRMRVLANAPGTPLPTLDRRLTWMSATQAFGRCAGPTPLRPVVVSVLPVIRQ